ncbi:GTP-binding protein YchF [Gongronella butleri]|nr:GTP-binding protein YchF [Gongronella butleri]
MGIIGLPNIGKSSLFNVLTDSAVPSENYPFCTIDPSEAVVQVPDQRFDWLVNAYKPKKVTPAYLTVMDIAGLVRGASKGEGLGNAFLSNVASVDGLYHVVRAFENDDITHVENTVDPVRDMEIIEDELQIKDEETIEREIGTLARSSKHKAAGTEIKDRLKVVEAVGDYLAKGKNVRNGIWTHDQAAVINTLHLLSAKPMVYLCNISQDDYLNGTTNAYVKDVVAWVNDKNPGSLVMPLSVIHEAQVAAKTTDAAQPSMMQDVILAGYQALQLQQFFTCGPDEVRAWSVRRYSKAPQAAGVIHTDFERGFISADIIKFDDLAELSSEAQVRQAGKCAQKGKDYVMQDGDIAYFKVN